MKKKFGIGIDLGTSRTVACIYWSDKTKEMVKCEGDDLYVPSVVASKDGKMLVGASALRQSLSNSINTIHSVKRMMGKNKEELKKNNLSENIILENKKYTPEEISAQILSKIKGYIEAKLNQSISKVVITVPAYFNDSERKATANAAKIAGLECERIINEPTAACLAYSISNNELKNGYIVAYDLGGGTFDVSIIDINDGLYEVKATKGDTNLGGDNFDQALMDMALNKFSQQINLPLKTIQENVTPRSMQRLYEAVKELKEQVLSNSEKIQDEIDLSFFYGEHDLKCTISRDEYHAAIAHYVDRTIILLQEAFQQAKVTEKDINAIIVVGGSTKTLLVREKLIATFGKEKVNFTLDPDQSIAIGASIQAAILDKVTAKDGTSGDSGQIVDSAGNPILFVDSTPFKLGIEIENGTMVPIIQSNATIPTTQKKIFTNAIDNQDKAIINVYQGERLMAKDNKKLGDFSIELAPAKANTSQIEVTFHLDMNQILTVTAKDLTLNREGIITISDTIQLSDDEIAKMRNNFEENKARDAKAEDLLTKRSRLEFLTTKIKEIEGHSKFNELESSEQDEIKKIKKQMFDLNENEELLHSKTMDEYNTMFSELSNKVNGIHNKLLEKDKK